MKILAKLRDDGRIIYALGHDENVQGRTVIRLDAIFDKFGTEVEGLSSDIVFRAENALDRAFMEEVLQGEKDQS